ncbi:MAG: 30S ribosomal protein S12 methylthiotransferase RimO [Lachnospiraceae bacterium]|nr:30S ribosomal protein S12 methylthiotransferase RimO [Lachnospiraceae bacterium]MDE7418408.1 30S ribosomal protein S12 methylthiotransferase RimO [Lachnospiraceae bacterium]
MNILFISLGCDKNLVDTEMMLGMLVQRGFSITDDETEADAVVVNTCCFINDAKQESINTLLEMAELRKSGAVKALIAAGCLAQRYQDEIQKEIPEVDAIVGTTAIDAIVDALDEVLSGRGLNHLEDINRKPVYDRERIVTTGGHYAYLKIAEGCDKHCSYCIIPKVRGNYRSIPMDSLVQEAEHLAMSGAKEIILVAQETTLYGVDLYGKKRLPELLHKLCAIPEIYWVRILYCYPEEITDELIETIRSEQKVCNYLDIPVQHASDKILKRMGRRTGRQELMDMISKLRDRIPDICLRTTLITGFPGETQEDHESLLEFVDEMEFDRLGVFTYSPEEDTPAALFDDQIDEEVKLDRQADIMELQQEIAFEKAQETVGSTLLVMVEGKVPDEHAYVARSYKDAPNVDGFVFVQTGRELMTGDFVRVRITGSHEYDLIGEIEDEFTE